MPFNGSNRIEALFAFVDQYVAGDPAMRSGFDQVFGDVVTSVNAAIAYLEDLAASDATTDQRYLGLVVAVPTQRLDASALQAGDFYVAGHADAGRLGLAYVYDGAGFDVVSDFASLGAFFKDTLSAAGTPAAARTALELGSMATQNTGSFAPASVATDVALAIKLLADGIAKSMTSNDWDNAHLAGPGTTMVAANAAALNAPVALNAAGIYVAYDANNGFVLAVAHSTGQIYYRLRVAAVWGTWREIATANLTAAEGDILYRAASAWTRLARGADGTMLTLVAGLPAWAAAPRLIQQTLKSAPAANFDWTGVPANCSEIYGFFLELSGTATAQNLIQLMVGGVPVTTGYFNTGGLTSGFSLPSLTSGQTGTGIVHLMRVDGNTWVMNSGASGTCGWKTFSGPVDGVRIVPSTGTFDAGQAGMAWRP